MASHALLGQFTKILARRPSPNLAEGLTMSSHLGVPDYAKALQQYENYLQSLRDCGMDVKVLDYNPNFPDGHFVEDPVIVFHQMAFLCRSGAISRRHEGESLLPHLAGLRIERMADNYAYMDGGDVLFCADRVLVGLSERTNRAGADALHQALKTVQPDIRLDCVEFKGLLHLKSGITEVAPNILVHDPAFITDYAFDDWAELITLPAEEGYAADLMPINEAIFIVKGFPTVKTIAEKYSEKVIELDMSEFRKMDGGLTCLSLRY